MANGQQGSAESLTVPFAVDSETGTVLSRDLETLLAWLSIVKRLPRGLPQRPPQEGIEFLARVYYPLWAVKLGGKLALFDPLADHIARVECGELPRLDGFVERLQETHRKVSMFRNMLEAYQNTFPASISPRTVEVQGLLNGSEAGLILRSAARRDWDGEAAGLPVIGGGTYPSVKGPVAVVQAVMRGFTESLEEHRLAKSVLRVETESQLQSLNSEIATLRAEYTREIEATKDLADRTIEALAKKRDDEIEIVASRFSEIKEMLITDMMSLKKAQSAIIREEGYLRKVAAASVASRLSPGSDMVKLLLGDHASRLRTVKDEASKIQVLVEEIEKEKGRELSAIKDLYDELIRAKSRVITDLQIELDVEVEKRAAEMNELRELQESIERKMDAVTRSDEEYLGTLDWLVADGLGVKENAEVYVPVYVAAYGSVERPFVVCSPGVFFSGAPPPGVAYALEDRLKALSSYLRALADVHLPRKAQRERDFHRKAAALVKGNDLLPRLPEIVAAGLRSAQERGWIAEARARAIEAMATKLSARAR